MEHVGSYGMDHRKQNSILTFLGLGSCLRFIFILGWSCLTSFGLQPCSLGGWSPYMWCGNWYRHIGTSPIAILALDYFLPP